MASRGPLRRELVFCHECQEEWYRNARGLVCPNESCRSEFVEIIEDSNDPRTVPGRFSHFDEEDDSDEFHHTNRPTSGSLPRETTFIRLEGPNFSFARTSHFARAVGTRPQPSEIPDEMIVNLFQNMIRNIVGDHQVPPAGPTEDNRELPASRNPSGSGLNPRDANSAQTGETPQAVDLATFLANFLTAPPTRPGNEQGFHAALGPLFANLFPGAGGDYVYSQSELDRVISQLMEQHQGNAPPPAPRDVIDSLPKIKVTPEMASDGTDCAVCKDDLEINTEVTKLPCNHVYHFECISKWLEVHDTCPICRHPVTPEEKRQEQQRESRTGTTSSFMGFFPNSPNLPGSFPGASQQESSNMGDGIGPERSNSSSHSGPSQNAGTRSSSNTAPRSSFANLFRRGGGS